MWKFLFYTLLFNTILNAQTEVQYRGSSNLNGGEETLLHFYNVKENENISYYTIRYIVDNAIITNLITNKSNIFPVFSEGGDPIPYKKNDFFDPAHYYGAFLAITNNNMKKGDKIISTYHNGIEIYCLEDMKQCKTDAEVIRYLRNLF